MTRKYRGLRFPNPVIKPTTITFRGAPCIYRHHAGDNFSASSWRGSLHHGCLECLTEIRKGRFSLDIEKLVPEGRYRAVRFWNQVTIGEWSDCWQWNDKPRSELQFFWRRPEIHGAYTYHPQRVLHWFVYGDTGRYGTISLCGERRCMNPLHSFPINIFKDNKPPKRYLPYLEEQLSLLKSQLNNYNKPELVIKSDAELIKGVNEEDLPRHLYLKNLGEWGEFKLDEFSEAYTQKLKELSSYLSNKDAN